MIRQIAEQCGDPNLPQEIYEACRNKQAFLFVRDRAGWVLKPLSEDGIPYVLIWVAWSERTDGLLTYSDEIQFLARKIGARFLRFHTARKGFLRIAPRLGWQRQADDADGLMVFEFTL